MQTQTRAAFAAVLVAGCQALQSSPQATANAPFPLDAAALSMIQESVQHAGRNPNLAILESIMATKNEYGLVSVCGYVNAGNAFGGYTGRQPFNGFFQGTGQERRFVTASMDTDQAKVNLAACKRVGITLR